MTDDNSKIFNRALLRKRRQRSAVGWAEHNFLKKEAALRLADCLDDVAREFSFALDVGCHQGECEQALGGKVGHIIGCDMSAAMCPHVVCDEELLPFGENQFDLVVSALSLHHVNDLPGTLIQIRNILKPDGLFLAIMFGASSLKELRTSVTGASAEQGFALKPMLSPLIEVRDAGALLQRAGFALPVVDSDTVNVEYETVLKLMQDLRGMGESNVLLAQDKAFTTRSHLAAIAGYYEKHFASADGAVTATVEFITMSGWKPHPSQQQPSQKGSGKVNLKQVL
jgi:SAM-dependent methyltransferase